MLLWRPITSQSFDNLKEVTMFDRDEFDASLLGFIVGGLSGAVVALLYAPQSGKETRALIKNKSIELSDRAQSSAKEAIARAETVTAEQADVIARWLRQHGQPAGAEDAPKNGNSTGDGVRSTVKISDETSETLAV
jgi:gas vesicle protein